MRGRPARNGRRAGCQSERRRRTHHRRGTLSLSKSTYDCGGEPETAWALGGSPADTVLVAMDELYAEGKPDLVVSGSNAGQNLSSAINHSGTLGAALTGSEFGVPSIAVSTGFTRDPAEAQAGYVKTAAWLIGVVAKLAATREDGRLLPRGVTLNLNHPVGPVGDTELTVLNQDSPFPLHYVPQPDGSLAIDLTALLAPPQGPPGTEDGEFAAGHPTITPSPAVRTTRPAQSARNSPSASASGRRRRGAPLIRRLLRSPSARSQQHSLRSSATYVVDEVREGGKAARASCRGGGGAEPSSGAVTSPPGGAELGGSQETSPPGYLRVRRPPGRECPPAWCRMGI